jgi:hypothetical protein
VRVRFGPPELPDNPGSRQRYDPNYLDIRPPVMRQ